MAITASQVSPCLFVSGLKKRKLRHVTGICLRNLCLPHEPVDDAHRHVSARIMDSFFTVHVVGSARGHLRPLYVGPVLFGCTHSETVAVDLCRDENRHHTALLVQVFGRACGQHDAAWVRTARVAVDVRDLVRVCKDSVSDVKPNTVLLEMQSELYTLVTCLVSAPDRTSCHERLNGTRLVTSNLKQLIQLVDLEACLKETCQTVAQVDQQLQELEHANELRDRKRYVVHQLGLVRANTRRTRLELEHVRGQVALFETRNKRVAKLISTGDQGKDRDPVRLQTTRAHVGSVERDIVQKQSETAATILQVTPIQAVPRGHSWDYAICGVAVCGDGRGVPGPRYETGVADAAYGMAAHIAHLLSITLGVRLRYPMEIVGSRTCILDTIGHLEGSPVFPLWSSQSVYVRFEYARYLLEQNVRQLVHASSLAAVGDGSIFADLRGLLIFLKARGAFYGGS